MDAVGTVNGVSIHEFDLDSVDDKPWRKPGKKNPKARIILPKNDSTISRLVEMQQIVHFVFILILHCCL